MFLVFLFLLGQHHMVRSYYILYFLLGMISLILLAVWMKWNSHVALMIKGWKNWVSLGLVGVVITNLIYMNQNVLRGLHGSIELVDDLHFPLKDGKYYNSFGGTTAILDNHF